MIMMMRIKDDNKAIKLIINDKQLFMILILNKHDDNDGESGDNNTDDNYIRMQIIIVINALSWW